MDIALWVITGVLAVAMLGAGLFKLSQSKEALASKGMGWTEDFSSAAVKAIGAAEVLGAIGLIAPAVLNIAPILVPIAATGIAVLMAGAVIVHLRRHEGPGALPAVVLLTLAVLVAGDDSVRTRSESLRAC